MSSATTASNHDRSVRPQNGDSTPPGDGNSRRHFHLKRGLTVPISGEPEPVVENAAPATSVAVLGTDYIGLKPTMAVRVGDRVKLGQLLFTDKKNPRVGYTSPACGTVQAINRGPKRMLISVVIAVDGDEEEDFSSHAASQIAELSRSDVIESLLASGLWPSLRTRPYSKVPSPEDSPHSLFVNAMDTNPLAVPPETVIHERESDFRSGLIALSKLTDGNLYLCQHPEASLPGSDLDGITTAVFEGPHPAGLVGTHIHFLDPVSTKKTVWHLNYQDVLAIGALFSSGKLRVERIISLAGPMVKRPRLLRTRLGANIRDLVTNELEAPFNTGTYRHDRIRHENEARVISGSALSGHMAVGPIGFLGRYHLQVTAIEEDPKRKFIEWHYPGVDRFSVTRLFLSKFLRVTKFRITTCSNGSPRSMVPIGSYELVMPLDIMPTFLLRALIVHDTDQAQALGCLELDEEDLALCTFACPAKYDYGPILRRNLTMIEVDG